MWCLCLCSVMTRVEGSDLDLRFPWRGRPRLNGYGLGGMDLLLLLLLYAWWAFQGVLGCRVGVLFK